MKMKLKPKNFLENWMLLHFVFGLPINYVYELLVVFKNFKFLSQTLSVARK